MKRFFLSLIAMVGMVLGANAMSYEQARQQALFLTDKMAYELNLTDMQYEAAYEVNLDYLLSINRPDDLYNIYWERRNRDLSYILFDWQYNAFVAASYFYRPLYWKAGLWHFGIYVRYPQRDYFYFGFPHFYHTYCGAHAWHMNGGRSWYHGRSFAPPHHDPHHHKGMRDGFHRGDFGPGHRQAPGGAPRDNNPAVRPGGNGGGSHGSSARPGGGSSARPESNGGGSRSSQFGSHRSSTRSSASQPSAGSRPSSAGSRPSSAGSRPSSAGASRPSSPAASRPSGGGASRSSGSGNASSGGGRVRR